MRRTSWETWFFWTCPRLVPTSINSDPYGEGWIAKIDLEDDEPDLMSAEEYGQLLKSLN